MYSVTKRVEIIKQPRGGYLKTGLFVKEDYKDEYCLNKYENIEPQIVGMVVDYLTRFISGITAERAFEISLLGAKKIRCI